MIVRRDLRLIIPINTRFPRRDDVERANQTRLQQLRSETWTYKAVDVSRNRDPFAFARTARADGRRDRALEDQQSSETRFLPTLWQQTASS